MVAALLMGSLVQAYAAHILIAKTYLRTQLARSSARFRHAGQVCSRANSRCAQIHFWAVLLGVVGAFVSLIYYYCVKYGIKALWNILPDALFDVGIFDRYAGPLT